VIRRARPSLSRLSRSASPLAISLLAAAALPLLASCAAATDTTATTSVVPTSLTVDPSTFLGDVVCSKLPGALKSYVATLTEITKTGTKLDLASSSPTPCSQAVSFRYVLDGHQYTVSVHGYDVLATDLVPCGGQESGSPIMLLASAAPGGACAAELTTGAVPVAPRWQTACGDVASSPITDGNVVARCTHPFEDVPGNGTTAIVVDPRTSLGPLVCANQDGQAQPTGTITLFDIKPEDANLNGYLGLACDDTAAKTYAKSLVPGATYTFHIAAHDIAETPGTPKYTAACSAVARQGLTVPAFCGPFTAP
jgi:hypothetical protein